MERGSGTDGIGHALPAGRRPTEKEAVFMTECEEARRAADAAPCAGCAHRSLCLAMDQSCGAYDEWFDEWFPRRWEAACAGLRRASERAGERQRAPTDGKGSPRAACRVCRVRRSGRRRGDRHGRRDEVSRRGPGGAAVHL